MKKIVIILFSLTSTLSLSQVEWGSSVGINVSNISISNNEGLDLIWDSKSNRGIRIKFKQNWDNNRELKSEINLQPI